MIFSKTFSKASVSALIAAAVDFGTLAFWVQILHGYYPIGVALGAALGAIVNFLVNRYWAFESTTEAIPVQASKYILVSAGSLCLNTGGVYFTTETFHLHYLGSKLVVSILVALFFNYPLQRYYVYSKGAVTV